MSMTLRRSTINARLHKLRIKPVENAKLIKKWERIERKFNEKEMSSKSE